jgi:hypothetical protein
MVDPGLVDKAFAIARDGEKKCGSIPTPPCIGFGRSGLVCCRLTRTSAASFAENEGLGMLQMSVAK